MYCKKCFDKKNVVVFTCSNDVLLSQKKFGNIIIVVLIYCTTTIVAFQLFNTLTYATADIEPMLENIWYIKIKMSN